jgi:DNA replication protein DnaC
VKHSNEALNFVESLFGYDVSEDELICGDDSYIFAKKHHNCQDNCPGMEKCVLHGCVPRVYEEELFGRRVFVVRAGLCTLTRAAMNQKRIGELVKASRIPRELAACSFENYKSVNKSTEGAKDLAMFCAAHGRGLLLEGPPGVGKTHLAVAVVNHAVANGRSAMFTPVVNLLDDLHEAVLFSRISSLLDTLRAVDCLVLDDLGIQKDSEFRGERLFEVVNDRYNAKKQIIVTTNARDMNDLKSKVGNDGAQIESRLSQMTLLGKIEAPDFRKRGKNAKNESGRDAA